MGIIIVIVVIFVVIANIIAKFSKETELTIGKLSCELENMENNEIRELLSDDDTIDEYISIIEKYMDENMYSYQINIKEFEIVLSKILNNCDTKTIKDIISMIYEKDEEKWVFFFLREKNFNKNVIRIINEIYREEVIFADTYKNRKSKIKKEYIARKIKEEDIFISDYDNMAIDYNKKKIYVKNLYLEINKEKVIEFNEIIECKQCKTSNFESKSNTKTKNGIDRAIVGGILFGGAGAIVGANTADRETQTETKEKIEKLVLKVITSNQELPIINLEYNSEYCDTVIDRAYAKIMGIISNCKSEVKKQ